MNQAILELLRNSRAPMNTQRLAKALHSTRQAVTTALMRLRRAKSVRVYGRGTPVMRYYWAR